MHEFVRARSGPLGDFTASPRMLFVSVLAVAIGAVGAVLAKALLALIALCTNLFHLQRVSLVPVTPSDTHLGPWAICWFKKKQ